MSMGGRYCTFSNVKLCREINREARQFGVAVPEAVKYAGLAAREL